MKIISVQFADGAVDARTHRLEGRLLGSGLRIGMRRWGKRATVDVGFHGATLRSAFQDRSAGKAAGGAIAGGLLFGWVGLLAGSAMGGATAHTLVLRSPDAAVVFEATTPEYQRLLGAGLPESGEVTVQGTMPTFKMSKIVLLVLWAISVRLFIPGLGLAAFLVLPGFMVAGSLLKRLQTRVVRALQAPRMPAPAAALSTPPPASPQLAEPRPQPGAGEAKKKLAERHVWMGGVPRR